MMAATAAAYAIAVPIAAAPAPLQIQQLTLFISENALLSIASFPRAPARIISAFYGVAGEGVVDVTVRARRVHVGEVA